MSLTETVRTSFLFGLLSLESRPATGNRPWHIPSVCISIPSTTTTAHNSPNPIHGGASDRGGIYHLHIPCGPTYPTVSATARRPARAPQTSCQPPNAAPDLLKRRESHLTTAQSRSSPCEVIQAHVTSARCSAPAPCAPQQGMPAGGGLSSSCCAASRPRARCLALSGRRVLGIAAGPMCPCWSCALLYRER